MYAAAINEGILRKTFHTIQLRIVEAQNLNRNHINVVKWESIWLIPC